MATVGPMVKVKTQTAAIPLDVDRLLNMGSEKVLRFIIPDPTQFSKWRTLLTLDTGWNRITPAERTAGDGREVIFRIADLTGAVSNIIRTKDLYVELDDEIYSIDDVPQVAPNVAQVYDITSKTRTLRNKYFDNKR